MSDALPVRPKFDPSGRIDFALTPLFGLPGWFGAMLLGAGILAFFDWVGFSILILFPLIAGAGVGFAFGWALRLGHCRSMSLAFVGGLTAGAFAYVYSFLLQVAIASGDPLAVIRVDAIPAIVQVVVPNWVIGKPGQNAGGNAWPVMNWILFVFEWGCCAIAAGGLAMAPITSGYCERCRRWMTKREVKTSPGMATAVAVALSGEKPLEAIAALPVALGEAPAALSSFTLEGCTHGGAHDESTFYLTANEIIGQGEAMNTETLLKQELLTPDEFAALAEKIPGFLA